MIKKRVRSVILFLLLGILLITCNKKKEGPCMHPNDAAFLYFRVVDNNGNSVGKAQISLFDSYRNYEDGVSSKNDPQYAQDTILSISGSEVFLMADPYKEHWILVTYYDSTQQKFLSSQLTTSKIDKLQSCSDYHLKINIEPVGGTVAFWTSSGINLPIIVQFNNVTDTLTDSTSVQPVNIGSPGSPKELTFPVKAGTYQYQASSADGCAWTGEITVKDGQFVTVKLEPCPRAVLAFYYNSISAIPSSKQSIDIYIDNNPISMGKITAPASGTIPTSCPAADNVLYLYLEPGVSHTYKAVSPAGSNGTPCFWSGVTGVLSTDCNANTPIYLGQGCN